MLYLADSKLRREEENETNGDSKFRKLQEKWEYLGRDENTQPATTPSPSSPCRNPPGLNKSKIPRLLTSPVKTISNLPIPIKSSKSPSGIPSLKKPQGVVGKPAKKIVEPKDSPRRTSRMDQENVNTPRAMPRPSSLPYKTYGGSAKEKNAVSPHRRAASTSLPRPHSIAAPPKPPKQPAK